LDSHKPCGPAKASEDHWPANGTADEGTVDAILKACDTYPDKANAIRLRALVLLLRYSGLRIRDAVTLARNRIQADKLFLFTAKTGTAVCPLPPIVMSALHAIPASTYCFWTGLSKPKSAVGDWQRSLKRLFKLAGVPDAHAHRFRDSYWFHEVTKSLKMLQNLKVGTWEFVLWLAEQALGARIAPRVP
jgi:integrase